MPRLIAALIMLLVASCPSCALAQSIRAPDREDVLQCMEAPRVYYGLPSASALGRSDLIEVVAKVVADSSSNSATNSADKKTALESFKNVWGRQVNDDYIPLLRECARDVSQAHRSDPRDLDVAFLLATLSLDLTVRTGDADMARLGSQIMTKILAKFPRFWQAPYVFSVYAIQVASMKHDKGLAEEALAALENIERALLSSKKSCPNEYRLYAMLAEVRARSARWRPNAPAQDVCRELEGVYRSLVAVSRLHEDEERASLSATRFIAEAMIHAMNERVDPHDVLDHETLRSVLTTVSPLAKREDLAAGSSAIAWQATWVLRGNSEKEAFEAAVAKNNRAFGIFAFRLLGAEVRNDSKGVLSNAQSILDKYDAAAPRMLALNALSRNGQNHLALTHFRELVEAWGDVAPVRSSYGLALLRAGKDADAREQFETAIELDSSQGEALLGLAALSLLASDTDGAREWLAKAEATMSSRESVRKLREQLSAPTPTQRNK